MTTDDTEVERYKRLEREWQDTVGHTLLDTPFELPGAAAVFERQFDRIIAGLTGAPAGAIVEVGCGKGHFLRRLRQREKARLLVGVELSVAVQCLPAQGLGAVKADGEFLPFRTSSVAAVVYNGALHHVIDYPAAVREAVRVLGPGGLLVIFEPVSSVFSRLVHRVLDPLVFSACCEYESPIDQRFKDAFHERRIRAVLREEGISVQRSKSDWLAYPLTGCYAGSRIARNLRIMRLLLATEEAIGHVPWVRHITGLVAWRFLLVGRKIA